MNCYLNNFSLVEADNGIRMDKLLKDFICVCDELNSYSFEKIFMPSEYCDIPLSESVTINQFIRSRSSQDSRQPIDDFISRIKSIRKNQLSKITKDKPDEKIQYIYYNGDESDFFKKAFNQNVPVVSFRTRVVFDNPKLDVSISYLDKDEQPQNSNKKVSNVSHADHFVVHKDFLEMKQREQVVSDQEWNALEMPFRMKNKMVQFLNEHDFENERNSDPQYKTKLFLETGTALAEMNGWIFHSEYSSRFSSHEKMRRIFYSNGKRRAYLSIDILHGEFELHQRNGKHIMSYNFNGESNGKSYHNTSHDLIF